jgi:acyl-CoA reductase-like NAD-dependent aldehyde dehydrogenase
MRCSGLVQEALGMGGRSLSGVAEHASDGWIRPIAVVDCPAHASLVQGDHFGPAIAVVPVDGLGEALQIHRGCSQALAASVFTRSADRLAKDARFLEALGASVVSFNECVTPTGHPGVAIAGAGASGWGASRGEAGLLELSRPLTVSRTAEWTPAAEAPPPRLLATLDRLVHWWHGAKSPERLEPPVRPGVQERTRQPAMAGKERD